MVSLSEHARFQLAKLERFKVHEDTVHATLEDPDLTLIDTATGNLIAINYEAKIAVAYAKRVDAPRVVTVIYSSKIEDLVRRRRRSHRWNKF